MFIDQFEKSACARSAAGLSHLWGSMENGSPDTPAAKGKKLSLSLSPSCGKRSVPLKDVGNSGNSKRFASPVKEREYMRQVKA